MYDSNKIANKSGQNQSQLKNNMKDKNKTNFTYQVGNQSINHQNKNNSGKVRNFTEFNTLTAMCALVHTQDVSYQAVCAARHTNIS